MAFIHGRNTVVTVGGVDLSAYTKKSDFDRSQDTHDVSAYGDSGHAYSGGLTDGSYSMDGTYSDDVAGPSATLEPLLDDKDGVTVIFRPEGTGTGLAQRSFTGVLASYKESDPVDDMIMWSAEFKISGAVDRTDQT